MSTTEARIGARLAGRKAMTRSLVVRVSDELHQKLQELAEKVSTKTSRKATVSDVARAVLEEATENKGMSSSTRLTFPNFESVHY
jgi:predicted transcriptional regulator